MLTSLIMFGAACWLGWTWYQDLRAGQSGKPNPHALPGATPANAAAVIVAIAGAGFLVAAETGGEIILGIAGEQTTVEAVFLLSMLAAGIIEEVVFRGYLVVRHRGPAALIGGIFGFSLLFAALHPYIWQYTPPADAPSWAFWSGQLFIEHTPKAWFSTVLVFLNSLWFYAVRFMPLNPSRSLLPCFAAHIASNLAVFAVKAAQGFVTL